MKRKKGFSLIETLIYLGIFSVFLVISANLFFTSLTTQQESSAISSVNQDGRFILLKIMYDINRSTLISIPQNPGDATSILQLTVDDQEKTYYLENSYIYLNDQNGIHQLNSTNTLADNLNFTKIGGLSGSQTIQVSYKLVDIYNKENRNFTSTFGQR
jgi:type II secretory pathway pseudopilin PulG